jgi:hypothetical protein
VDLAPDYAEAHVNRALTRLHVGDWQRGWQEFEWRWRTADALPRGLAQPWWRGEPLAGRTILLYAEQGLGDTIQFIRFAPIVKRRGGTVVVECQQPLVRLLEGCAGVDRLVGQGDALPAFDVQAPLLSLPGILKTSPETIPADVPYLSVRPAAVQAWRERLKEIDGFRIGIAWQGNPAVRGDRLRSIALGHFAALAEIPGVRLVSLQKGPGAEQLEAAGGRFRITELGSRLQDFADTAAVMNSLDLVITSDTGPAHLAGALGVPVWVALSLAPDWRWSSGRSDSPWYPTMRLFRQKEWGNWQAVFEEIKKSLCELVSSSRGGSAS